MLTTFIQRICLAITLLATSVFPAQALDVELGRPQIQLLLNSVFPHQQSFGQWQVEFTHPYPGFQASQQKISLGVNVNVNDQQRSAKANGTITGQLRFNPQTQELQLIKPALTQFNVTEGDPQLQQQLRSSFAQQLGQHMPLIVLFDIKNVLGNNTFLQPKGVSVIEDGLSIQF